MKKLCLLLGVMASSLLIFAQEKPIALFPNGVPNSKKAPADYAEKTIDERVSLVTDPTITPFFPEKGKANGAAVVICPGGAYSRLAINKEGYSVAKEFNKIGVTAFVLKYRLPNDAIMADKTVGPLQDAQQAILTVRSHASEWGISPNRVGIIGFSAGGHLASTAGTHFDKAVVENKTIFSIRPDFMILMYPVISFGEFAHVGSKENLAGKNATAAIIDLYSNEKHVTATTPPTFIVHAQDDDVVPVQNSLLMYDALIKAKVSTEMHLYPAGGHGFGLNNAKSKARWFDWCAAWLDTNGFLVAK